ncbi:MAG: hypothetical protein O7B23_12340 [Deltaproteobacteria bacterium]|nr:hypothetical protein [Deltaproteobacteria bacterium]
MSWLEPIEPLIGLLTVVLLLSVIVTALTQATGALLRLRGRNLARGLEALFRQASAAVQDPGTEKPIGLLVVHGIGKPKPGEMRDSVVRGLGKAYPEARFESHGKTADMVYSGRRVRIYEVYWAPVLMGEPIKGSFSIDRVHELIWFPGLNNAERGSRHQSLYPPLLVKSWTRFLIPLGMLLTWVYLVISAALKLPAKVLKFWPAEAFDDYLAERVGDVFNYADACVGADPTVPEAHEKIYEIFHDTLRTACEECSEIQILAHSLGAVVVDHALTRFGDQTREVVALTEAEKTLAKPRLTRLYTIGTPMEKVLFFWPKLVQPEKGEEDFQWDNFSSHLDVVSGTINRFSKELERGGQKVINHPARGTGGILTAHSGYRMHPSFLGIFGPGLTSCPTKLDPRPRWRRLSQLRDIAETVLVAASVIGFAVFGFVLLVLGVYSVSVWLLGSMVGLEWSPQRIQLIASGIGLAVVSALVLFAPFTAREAARRNHEAHWTTVTPEPTGTGSDEP